MKTFKVNAIRQTKVGHKPYLVTVNNYSFETNQAYLFDSAKTLECGEINDSNEQEAIKKAIENIKIGLSDSSRLNVFNFEVTNSDGNNIIGYAEFEITLNEAEKTLNASAINDEFCKESEVSISVEADASYYEHLETLYTSIIEQNEFY